MQINVCSYPNAVHEHAILNSHFLSGTSFEAHLPDDASGHLYYLLQKINHILVRRKPNHDELYKVKNQPIFNFQWLIIA